LSYHMRHFHRLSLGMLSCSNCAKRSPISSRLLVPNTTLWCYRATQDKPWRIYLSEALLTRAVQWYHHALSHVGQNRLLDTMSMTFYNPVLHKAIEAVVLPCAHCQHYKNVQRGHGATVPREADTLLWSHVAVDTIGPWVLKVQNRQERFYTLTIIYILCLSSNLPCRKAPFTSTMNSVHPANSNSTKTIRIVASFTTGDALVSSS
jgi:Integrase zinc binding domain